MRSPLMVLAVLLLPASAMAAEDVRVPHFRNVELHDGGAVVVRHGPAQRVTVTEGNARLTRFSVEGEKLTIVNCPREMHCPMNYRLHVEIVTPSVMGLAVSGGGVVRTEGAFPAQETIAAAVRGGGVVDARSVPGDRVAAAVRSGGRVLVTARANLAASVSSGGQITYWGNPSSIVKSIDRGGMVTRGAPGDAGKPIVDLMPRPPRAPTPPRPPQAVPAVPPVPEVEDYNDPDTDVEVERYGDEDTDSSDEDNENEDDDDE